MEKNALFLNGLRWVLAVLGIPNDHLDLFSCFAELLSPV